MENVLTGPDLDCRTIGPPRKVHTRGHVWRDGDRHLDRIAIALPARDNFAADRVIRDARPGQISAGDRTNDHMTEARRALVRVDSANHADHPLRHRANGIMTERIHERILKATPLDISIPPLPDGGGAVIEHVAPRWNRTIVDQLVCGLVKTMTRKL